MLYLICGVSNQNYCDCCGKVDLKKTIVIEMRATIYGETVKTECWGTHCAATKTNQLASGIPDSNVNPTTIAKIAKREGTRREDRKRLMAQSR